MTTTKKYKTGLVLSGGGTRGFAHKGVLKALNEKGIFPDVIAGTSAGAIAAVLYADGHTPDEIMSFFKDKELLKYIEIILPKTGLVKMTGIIKLMTKYLRAKTFEELKIPVHIAACNINTGLTEYCSKGDLIKPLIASASIPVLFSPVKINEHYYVDGGVMDNFPIETIEKDAEKIIGVYVCPIIFQENFNNIKDIAMRTFHLAVNNNMNLKSKKCDIYIAPDDITRYGLLDVKNNQQIFKVGYNEAKKILKSIE